MSDILEAKLLLYCLLLGKAKDKKKAMLTANERAIMAALTKDRQLQRHLEKCLVDEKGGR